jgi:hypothetical protein
MLGRFPGAPGLVPWVLVALALSGLGAARADGANPPMVVISERALSARTWGMGGASAAVPQSADRELSNPAGALLTQKQEVIIGYVNADSVAALALYEARDVSSSQGVSLLSRGEQAAREASRACPGVSGETGALLTGENLRLALGRCGAPGSRWAWSAQGEAACTGDAQSLGLGLLYRGSDRVSLGFEWDDLLVTGGYALSATTVGAAYELAHFTIALDRCAVGGNTGRGAETLAGAEYRFDNGFALRVGSASGDLTYGIGYRSRNWSVNLARLVIGRGELLLPGTTLEPAADLAFLSLTCSY